MDLTDFLRHKIGTASTVRELERMLEIYLSDVELSFVGNKEVVSIRMERALVEKIGGLKIEIRPREQCHNIPHFHISYPGIDASFAIDDCRQLAGPPLRRKVRRIIHRFFNEDGGMERLVSVWTLTRPTQ